MAISLKVFAQRKGPKPHIFFKGGLWIVRDNYMDMPFRSVRAIQNFFMLGHI